MKTVRSNAKSEATLSVLRSHCGWVSITGNFFGVTLLFLNPQPISTKYENKLASVKQGTVKNLGM